MPQKTCEYVIRINETQRRLLLNACACHAGTLEYASQAEEETALLATLFGELADHPIKPSPKQIIDCNCPNGSYSKKHRDDCPLQTWEQYSAAVAKIGVTDFTSDGYMDAAEFDVPVPSAPART